MRGNGDSVLDLDLLASPWSFWFCPWSCWFVTANLKRSFTRKEKPKKRKRKKKRKKLKQKQTKLFLRPQNDRAGGQKSSLLAQVGTFKLFLALFKHFSTGSNQMLHVLEHSKIALFSKKCAKCTLRPWKRHRWRSKKLSKRITCNNKNGWFFNRFHPETQIFLWKPYSSKIVLYFKLCKIFSQNHFDCHWNKTQTWTLFLQQ